MNYFVYTEEIKITGKKIDGIKYSNITQEVENAIQRSGIKNGCVIVKSLHTTAAPIDLKSILANQEDERGLKKDIKNNLNEIIKCWLKNLENKFPEKIYYEHDDFCLREENIGNDEPKNGHSHIKALASCPSAALVEIVKNGRLLKGDWQMLLFFDFDPENRPPRTLVIQVMGTK